MRNTGKTKNLKILQHKSRSFSLSQMYFSALLTKEQRNSSPSQQSPRRITTIYEICSPNHNHLKNFNYQHNSLMLKAQLKKFLCTISPRQTPSLGLTQQNSGKMNLVQMNLFFNKIHIFQLNFNFFNLHFCMISLQVIRVIL